MSSHAKPVSNKISSKTLRIEAEEAAAIGTLLLLDRLESAGPIGRIAYRELKQHDAGAILLHAETEEDIDPSGD